MSGIYDTYSGSLTTDVLTFNSNLIYAPDTLHIRMTRGERRIADELHEAFGGFKRVVIDVDGEQHEFSSDSLIRMLEGYEGAPDTRYSELFGTPKRAAWALHHNGSLICSECLIRDECKKTPADSKCMILHYDALLEWLRGASDGE